MNNPYRTALVIHRNITSSVLDQIIALKESHWPYGVESQKHWIEQNMRPDDLHILLTNFEGDLLAYANMVSRVVTSSNDSIKTYLAIGNVSAARIEQGLGTQLMGEINGYLEATNQSGILLCNTQNGRFYHKQGWRLLNRSRVNLEFDLAPSKQVYVYNVALDKNEILDVTGSTF